MMMDSKRSTSQSLQLGLFILASIAVGLFAVFYGRIFALGEDHALNLLNQHPNLLLVVTPIFFLASSAICRFFAPEAGGGGIAKVREALEHLSHESSGEEKAKVRNTLGSKTIVIKFLSSIFMIAGGGALGREGPVVQMTAGIFSTVGRRSRRLLPDIDLRSWIIAGSAAGLAAAFNTPLGGLVFALEELTELHVSRIRAPLFMAVVTAGLTALALSGPYLLFATSHVVWKSSPWGILSVLLIGVISGAIVVSFQEVSMRFHRALEHARTRFFWIVPLLCGLAVAIIARSLGSEVIGGGIASAQALVNRPYSETSTMVFPGHLITTLLTLASGAAGGLLAPGLSLGAQMGAILAKVLGNYIDPTLLILASMAAFLSALVSAPFTAAVLAMEMTNQHDLIFPLLISTLVSMQTASFLRSLKRA
ncbi:MAG: chloride channel protein [Bdellovibrionales bacterium]|nr:chloride channel protein [Bdellovibrionales bacterium]